MVLNDFYQNTTKKFTQTISYNGSAPDITSDTVTFYLKKDKSTSDEEATLTKEADVTTAGVNGTAIFNLSNEETDIEATLYYYKIVWDLSNGERYILEADTVRVLNS